MNTLSKISGEEIRITGRMLRIARLEADELQFVNDPAALIEALREQSERVDLFTFIQPVTQTTALYNFPAELDNYAALPITTFDEWWNDTLGFKGRNKAKQAQKKGVVVKEVSFSDELVRGIWEIYNESPIRQGRRFPHFGKDLKTVYREEATFLESSIFIGAFLQDKLIGFIKMVVDQSGTQAGTVNIIALISERDKSPMNAMVAQAVRSCAERGIRYLTYSKFVYGNKERSGITDFKERNGFQKIDVPRYYVPLTVRGKLALRYKLYKKPTDHIPEWLLSRLRDLRAAWYRRIESGNASA